MHFAGIGKAIVAVTFTAAILTAGTAAASAAGLGLTWDRPAPPGTIFIADSDGVFETVFSGRSDFGTVIAVTADAFGSPSLLCEAVAQDDSTWSCTATTMPDFFGNVTVEGAGQQLSETFGAVNPPTVEGDPATGLSTDDDRFVVRGGSAPNAALSVLRAESTACVTTADAAGLWSCELQLTDADAGVTTLAATQRPPYSALDSAPSRARLFEYEPALLIIPVLPTLPSQPAEPVDAPVLSPPTAPTAPADPASLTVPGSTTVPAFTEETPSAGGSASVNGADAELAPRGGRDAPLAGQPTRGTAQGGATATRSGEGVALAPVEPQAVPAPSAGTPAGLETPGSDGATERQVTDAAAPSAIGVPPVSQFLAGWASPSIFGSSLRPFDAVPWGNPAFLAAAAVVAAGLLLLLALPAELLQSTIRENYHRIAPRLGWAERGVAGLRRRLPAITATWPGQAGLFVGAAAVMSFADPSSAFDVRTLRLVLGLVVVLGVVNYVGILANHLHATRRFGASTSIVLRPAALLLVVASVVVSRSADIQPGLLFGLILGVEVGDRLAGDRRAKLVVSVSLVLLGLGLASWVVFSLAGAGWRSDPTFGNQLAAEVLSGVTMETITALIIALLPVTFLDGKTVFAWSRAAWLGLYALAAAVFAVVLLPLPTTWVEVPTLIAPWSIGFACFTVLSIGVWAFFRFRPDQARSDAEGRGSTPPEPAADRLAASK